MSWIKKFFTGKKAFEIKRLPVGLELSDGDRAALYGWPDVTVDTIGSSEE